MYIDYLTTAALAHELREAVLGARVQDVLQPTARSLALELYASARYYLTLSADPGHEGVLFTQTRARRGEGAVTQLLLSARKTLQGARLQSIDQPPHERILRFTFVGDGQVELVAELMGRLANLILVEPDGSVLACAHKVSGHMTRARIIAPRRPYEPPPPPPKIAPETVTGSEVDVWLAEDPSARAWRVLVRNVLGVSPLVGREAVFRASGDEEAQADSVDSGALSESLRQLTDLARTQDWAPCVVRRGDEVTAYAPYELKHRGRRQASDSPQPDLLQPDLLQPDTPQTDSLQPDLLQPDLLQPIASVAECIALYLSSRIGRDPYQDARAAVAAEVEGARQVAERQLSSLRRERIDDEAIARLRLSGDLILAFQTQIEPGQRQFEPPPGTGVDGPIHLDPQLSAIENAQAKYKSYQRKRDAAANAPRRIAAAAARLATIEQLATDLAIAENRSSIDGVRHALVEGGFVKSGRKATRAPEAGRPLELESGDGLTILVGRNSRQNERVTFHRAKRGDIWLHARNIPGSHVVVKSAGQVVPDRTIQQAAALAAWFSRSRTEGNVAVAFTDVRYVKRMRGAGVGMVTYDHDETLLVAPTSPDALGLS